MRTPVGRSRGARRILQCFLVLLWSICAAAIVQRAGVGGVNGELAGGREFRDGRLEELYGLRGGVVKQEEGRPTEDGRQLAVQKVDEEEIARSVAVLVDFKRCVNASSASIADWNYNSSAQMSGDPYSYCDWTGVTCSPRGRVFNLSLPNADLQGSITGMLANLTGLEILDLSNNSLTGSLPSDLPRRLTQLWLEENALDGEIPESLSQLSELEFLDLGSNRLRGGIPPHLFSNWTSLTWLLLYSNELSGHIPSSVGQLQSLQFLFLFDNAFSGPIPSALANCSSLTILNLANNSLSHSIPSELGSISFLGIDRTFAADQTGRLILSGNRLSGQIPPSLGNCSSLRYLELANNSLTNTIPAEIGQLADLSKLFLQVNALTGNIPAALGNLSQLEVLHLSLNKLSGSIPESVTLLPNLLDLELSYNRLQGSIPPRISSTRLQNLYLNMNLLSGKLPSSAANCTKLLTLDLGSNFLTGLIAPSLGNITELQGLILRNNHFLGSIPPELADCLHLTELNLGFNNLSGRIPSSFGNLRHSLQRLYVQHNQLQGSIPSSLGNAVNLLDINLSHNILNKSIPASIFNIQNLALNLDLSHNLLTGQIPQGVGAFVSVQSIDLSANQFYGTIPIEFAECKNLNTLNLSFNALSGTIPRELGGLKFLLKLDLSVNNLSGEIPWNLSESQIQFFNVSNNQLDGQIPATGAFSNLTASSFLNNHGLCGRPLPFNCSHSSHSSRSTGSVVAATVCGIFGAALFLCCLVTWRYKSRLFLSTKKLSNQDLLKGISIRRVTPQELHVATNGYCESNILGAGGSSKVYRGILRDGTAVAIKRFNLEENQKQAEHIFLKECEILRKTRHRNLVTILSTCCNLEMRAIVLEYMPNGSLEKHLFGGDVYDLDWNTIFHIALDVGNALVYLHFDYGEPIIHCDLKPSNILLDKDFVAHVADFGIAKLLSPNMITSSTSQFGGSIGYIAPEFAEFAHHSTKGDVYSYGVVLLCMLTRKQPTSDIFDHGVDLSTWVTMFLPDMFLEVIDSTLRDQVRVAKCEAEVLLVLKVALLCTSQNPSNRPTSKEVLEMLLQIRGYRSNSNSRSSIS